MGVKSRGADANDASEHDEESRATRTVREQATRPEVACLNLGGAWQPGESEAREAG